jgi:hypothetical protein
MENVKEFMLLFRMRPATTVPTAEQVAIMHQQWQEFIGFIAAQAKLVQVTRFAFEGAMLNDTKTAEAGMVVENGRTLSGSMTLKAADLEEAITFAKRCPVLLAGGTVEVRPTIAMN